ncbi:MAG: YibE/F family protein [Lachnospiraceae bacterium]|nr:YibE/F family protein [Lachnospiraceae bacterium]
MRQRLNRIKSICMKKERIPVLISLMLILFLCFLPTGYEGALLYQTAERCKAEVISTNNEYIIDTGLVRSGEQICTLTILDGKFKGETVDGVNQLKGSLESDKIFAVGDVAQVVIDHKDGEINAVTMIDHDRIGKEIVLLALFALFLILFAGRTGVNAIISFVVTILAIWKVVVPLYLKGANPVLVGIAITIVLTAVIISLVYGINKKLLAAVSGAGLGILVTCIVGMIFTDQFRIHGAVMSYSESLLYSGYQSLNLTSIFMASIFIGSSGAMMDLAVDITSAVHEVVANCPEISRKHAIRSGMNVGRAAMGTMATTLLLAYSGGYIALLMVFMAQGTPMSHILNYKYVSAEILHTIVGSFGLITVAPFTAITAGMLLTKKKKAVENESAEGLQQNLQNSEKKIILKTNEAESQKMLEV